MPQRWMAVARNASSMMGHRTGIDRHQPPSYEPMQRSTRQYFTFQRFQQDWSRLMPSG